MDYGTASSWQSQASEIRTDGRNIIIQELLELRNEVTHQQGYQADSSTDDDSSEGSFTHPGQEDQNSRLSSPSTMPTQTGRQCGRRRTVWDALRQNTTRYVSIHPHHDFGSIGKEKNADMVRIGYCNVDGFKGNVVGNRKVNAIRRYALKHDLDAFFGAQVNINWKKVLESGQLPELFHSENAICTISSYNKFENWGRLQQGGTFGLAFG